MKKARRGIVLKLLIVAVLIYVGVKIVQVRKQIPAKEKQVVAYDEKIEQQTIANANLQKEIDSEWTQEQIKKFARDRLGLISPDEQIYINVTGE